MINDLLLNPKTKKQALQVIKSPAQALLVVGPAGSGKLTLAQNIAALSLGIDTSQLDTHPHYIHIQKPDSRQEISIDLVRDVIRRLNLKVATGSKMPVNRVVLIDEAHLSSAEAQNALLKIIEEPPSGSIFILTTLSDKAVLPTIASRAEKLTVLPVDLNQAKKYYHNHFPPELLNSAWQLSAGAAGLLHALLQEDSEHPLKKAVDTAKKFISMDKYSRLLFVDGLSSQKPEFQQVLEALGRILTVLHHSAIKAGNHSQSQKITKARQLVNSTIEDLQTNISARLLALNLVLNLPI